MLSLAEYQSARSVFLQQQSSFESARMSVDNQQMSILQSEQSIFDLEQQRIDEEQRLTTALASAREQLSAQIRLWEQTYLLEVEFPAKLVTTYGKELTFSQEMTGTAEIITGDLRLLDKFLNPIKAVIKK